MPAFVATPRRFKVAAIKAYRDIAAEIAGVEAMLEDPATEAEMRALAAGEKPALETQRTALEEQSHVCGSGHWRTLRKVTLPAIAPSIGAAFLLMIWSGFGLFSVAVAVPFILVQRDLKRLLAYSSVEHMGLMTAAIGIGGPARYR